MDNDPIVLAHARALLTGTPDGPVAYLHADLRGPEEILAPAAETLDFSQPVALMMLTNQDKRPFQEDTINAYQVAARALDASKSTDTRYQACFWPSPVLARAKDAGRTVSRRRPWPFE